MFAISTYLEYLLFSNIFINVFNDLEQCQKREKFGFDSPFFKIVDCREQPNEKFDKFC